jgi:tetratricopeptide (TPR) repeat protein
MAERHPRLSHIRMMCWLVIGLAISASAQAMPVRVSDPLEWPGWRHFYNNEYSEAAADFEQQTRQHPDDPNCFNHLAQAVLYGELFRNGALESQLVTGNNPFLRAPKMNVSKEVHDRFFAAIQKAMALANQRVERDPHDAAALYALSVSHGLRANYSFLVEKAWTDSLKDATASRKYSNRVLELEPNLTDGYLVQGLHDYVVGSLPFYMRMLGFLTGFHGDRDKGLKEIQRVAQQGVLNRYDARILLAAIYRRERRPSDAIPLLKDLQAMFPRNVLLRLEQVQMYSDAGDKRAALQVLDEVEQLKRESAPGYREFPLEKLKYLRGNVLFWYGDIEPALTEMKYVTARAGGLDLNTAVLAWLRLGQLYDMQGNHPEAIRAYEATMRTAPESAAASEAKGYISARYKRKNANG